jgi:hypothetical protein
LFWLDKSISDEDKVGGSQGAVTALCTQWRADQAGDRWVKRADAG